MDDFDKMQKKLLEDAELPELKIIDENGDAVPCPVEGIVSSYAYHGATLYQCINYTYGYFWVGKMKTVCSCCGEETICFVTGRTRRELHKAVDQQIENGIPSPL